MAKVTESDLMALVAKKYSPPEWAFLRQVRNQTGYQKSVSYADGIALNLWPSRGMELHGFEAKCSRSDWLSELHNPEKSVAIQQYCDKWWIVIPDDQAIKKAVVNELPPTWGLMFVSGNRLKISQDAPKLKDPKPLDKAFVASILRSVNKKIKDPSSDLLKAAKEQGIKEGRKFSANGVTQEKVERLEKTISDFEKASGISINSWNAGDLGKAVYLLQRRSSNFLLDRLKSSVSLVKTISNNLKDTIEAVHALDDNKIND